MEIKLLEADSFNGQRYTDVANWSLEKCVSFQALSEYSQAKLGDSKATAAKIAVDKRIQDYFGIPEQQTNLRAPDYIIAVNSLNVFRFVLESQLVRSTLPLVLHGSQETMDGELSNLLEYLSQAASQIDEHYDKVKEEARVQRELEANPKTDQTSLEENLQK